MSQDEHDDIVPPGALMEHLCRACALGLIQGAGGAFMVMFHRLLFFARHIYTSCPFRMSGSRARTRNSLQRACWNISSSSSSLAMFAPPSCRFSGWPRMLYMFRVAGSLTATISGLCPLPISSRRRSSLPGKDRWWSYFLPSLGRCWRGSRSACSMPAGDVRRDRAVAVAPRSTTISALMMRPLFAFVIAFQLPVVLTLLGRVSSSTSHQLGQVRYFAVGAFRDRGGG